MTTDDAWDVAIAEGRVPESLLPVFFVTREIRTKERVRERTMRD